MENKHDFTKTKAHLQTLTKLEDKIKYLLEVKTDYAQTETCWEIELVPFDKKCALELSKLYELLDLENRYSKNKKPKREIFSN